MTFDIWSRVLSSETSKLNNLMMTGSIRLATSDISSCMNSVDLFGRALSIDNAYRHMNAAEQYLMDASNMQDTAPHTNAAKSAIDDVVHAKEWLRDYAVSPDTAICRKPPVCQTVPPKKAALDSLDLLVLPRIDRRRTQGVDFF
jgi:hypothetical protein